MPVSRTGRRFSLTLAVVALPLALVAALTLLPVASGADKDAPPKAAPIQTAAQPPAAKQPAANKLAADEEQRELERARREVKLLDAMYKTAIVLITEHYVEDDSDLPAGEAFKALFAGMKEQGWHEVRLLDATGEPLNDDNLPQDDFEKQAVKSLLAGKPYYEEHTTKDGKQVLRAATPIPVVMKKCTLCHDNYRDQPVIGVLGYTLPLSPRAAAAR